MVEKLPQLDEFKIEKVELYWPGKKERKNELVKIVGLRVFFLIKPNVLIQQVSNQDPKLFLFCNFTTRSNAKPLVKAQIDGASG